jgi:uncharacterized membrane protein YphA (DoxX/SURF4 family)
VNRWSKGFLIALRIAVGWHFLYEGVFKIDSDTGSTSYQTARYGLQASTARLRDYFATDPRDLDAALARVDAWHDEIVKQFAAPKSLAEDQKGRLAAVRDQVKAAAASAIREEQPVDALVNFDWIYVHDEVLKVAAEEKNERFTSLDYLRSSAGPLRPLFRGIVHDIEGVERLTPASARVRLDDRYRQIVEHFESHGKPLNAEQKKRLAAVRDGLEKAIVATLTGPAVRQRLEDYKLMLARVHSDDNRLTAPFSRERLDADRKKLDVIADELLAFVNEPLAELASQAQSIATVAQLGAGPIPRPPDSTGWIDWTMKWGLTAIGLCLVLGLFTPVAALAAAAQLALFYFASPPWPALPAASLGGHYLYVDRNLIEMIAALTIATTGTGRIAGLDFYVSRHITPRLRRTKRETPEILEALPRKPMWRAERNVS